MQKIVFILSSIQDPHAIKRIQEFKEHGYNYEVCGFTRDKGKLPGIQYTEIGTFVNGSSYFGRLFHLIPTMYRFLKKYDKENVVFFCFGFDIALFVYLFSKKKFFYESCDLMYTYFKIKLPFLVSFCKFLDRKLIKASIETVLTSEGFIRYLYKSPPENITLIANRLNPAVLKIMPSAYNKRVPDLAHLVISFNGSLRDNYLLLFAETIADEYPAVTVVFNGIIQKFDTKHTAILEKLKKASNVQFTGEFKNPDALPELHEKADLLLCTYDTTYENVRYAEPNKIYESIFFHTPIIVSEGTFLAEKVRELGIGYAVNAADPASIRKFLDSLTVESILEKQAACAKIPQEKCLNVNDDFFMKIKGCLS